MTGIRPIVQAAYDAADLLGAHNLPAHAVTVHDDRISVLVTDIAHTATEQADALAALRVWAAHLHAEPTAHNIAGYWTIIVHGELGGRELSATAHIPVASSAGLSRADVDELLASALNPAPVPALGGAS